MALSGTEQAFLQKMMAMKAMSLQEALRHYNKCDAAIATLKNRNQKPIRDASGLEEKFLHIDKAINPCGFQLRAIYSKWENKTFWGLINIIEDEAAVAANLFSKNETAMFFDIIEELLETECSYLGPTRAHEIGREHHMTTIEAAGALQKMERLRWFKVIRPSPRDDAKLVFGPRSLLELPRVRAQALRMNRSQGALGTIGSDQMQTAILPQSDEDDEEVVISRGVKRRHALPRTSQQSDGMHIDQQNGNLDEDEDEDEIRPSQSQTRSRTSRLLRRSSRRP